MLKEDEMNKIYDAVIYSTDLTITTKELNSCGLYTQKITKLVEDGILLRVKRGHYFPLLVDGLYKYGMNLKSQGDIGKANDCFKKCYKLMGRNIELLSELFLISIKEIRYDEALKYVESIICNGRANEYQRRDGKLNLYLLSLMMKLPYQFKQDAKFMTFDDVKVLDGDSRYDDLERQNQIRELLISKKFSAAFSKMNKFGFSSSLNIEDKILYLLTEQVVKKNRATMNSISNAVFTSDYDKAISILENKQEFVLLTDKESMTLQLCRKLKHMMESGTIPKKKILSTDDLQEAIDGNNFELALEITKNFIHKYNIQPRNNILYVLTTKICNFINSQNKSDEKNTIINNGNVNSKITECLLKNDIDGALLLLENYLNSIGKKKYEFLVADLIKVSLFEQDKTFSKPIMTLHQITDTDFSFDVKQYIVEFYEAIYHNKIEEASTYLDILSKVNELENSCGFIERLEQTLNDASKTSCNIEEVKEIEPKIDDETQVSNQNEVEDEYEEEEYLEDEPQNSEYDIVSQADIKFMKSRAKRVEKKGVLLLKPMKNDRINRLREAAKDIPGIIVTVVNDDSKERIFMRKYLGSYDDSKIQELYEAGDTAYKTKNNKLCIEKYEELLLHCAKPSYWVYAKLGFSHFKLHDKSIAIDYLVVANSFAKKFNKDVDFRDMIDYLRGVVPSDETKRFVRMQQTEFCDNQDNYYGINNIEEIAELVYSGTLFDKACQEMNLDDRQKLLVSLIFARECYMSENYEMGDDYLKRVQTARNKDKFVILLMNEVMKNKKFYKNRVTEETKRLKLVREL